MTVDYHFFVAHQFAPKEKDDLRDAIELAFRGTGMNPFYADMEVREGGVHILDKIKDMILRTQFGIFDITKTEKPNVFLELGIAMTAQKPCYIICEKGAKIPADLQGLDRIEYVSYKDLTQLIKKYVVEKESQRLKKIRGILLGAAHVEYDNMPEQQVLQRAVKIYNAEDLNHRIGIRVDDENASNSKAWLVELTEKTHILYGPYHDLPDPGGYIAFFKMKADENYLPEPVLSLEVSRGIVDSRVIHAIEFRNPTTYQLFAVPFKYSGGALIEYRVYNLARRGKLWIDYVAVIKQAELHPH